MADPAYRQITVRMLLNHSAGLPGSDYANSSTTEPWDGYDAQVLRGLSTETLKTTPGSMNVYCNDCFTLAAMVVGRVSGVPFTQYVHDHITAPLGMDRSGYSTTAQLPANFAAVLTPFGPVPHEYLNAYASGGFYSTPTDMSSLAGMLANSGTYRGRRILSADSVRKMATNQIDTTLRLTYDGSLLYGLGWDTVAEPGLGSAGVTAWQKGGDTQQYHAALLIAPRYRTSVVVLTAGAAISSSNAATLAQFTMLQALVEGGSITDVPTFNIPTPAPAQPTVQKLRAIQGTYLASGLQSRVVVNPDDSLTLSLYRNGVWAPIPAEFTYRSDGAYWTDAAPGTSLTTVRGWDRTYLLLQKPGEVGDYLAPLILGQRVTPAAPITPTWQARVDKRWVPVSEIATSFFWFTPDWTTFTPVENLPGYLSVTGSGGETAIDPGTSETVGAKFLVVPLAQGRDLNDTVAFPRQGQEWLRIGTTMLRPMDGIATLTQGTNEIPIGPEGYAEWRAISTPSTLAISGESSWRLYDKDLQVIDGTSGSSTGVTAPAGSYLVVFAPPGTSVTATVA
jgi:hypothetical protein